MQCWMCEREFEPSPERVKLWAESGRDFEPTDWECPSCEAYQSQDTNEPDLDWFPPDDYESDARIGLINEPLE